MHNRQEFLVKVGQRLKDARKDRGLSQKALGNLVDKSPDAIATYEAGTREMGLFDLVIFSEALEIPLSHFAGTSTVSKEVELAEYALVGSLRLAAKITLYRYLKLQFNLDRMLAGKLKNYLPRLNMHEVEQMLWTMRDGTLVEIERYLETIANFYKRMAEVFPTENSLDIEIEPWKIYADDIEALLNEASKEKTI